MITDAMSSTRRPVVAIDGPVGTGKSTVARLLANRLGFTYVDTGAMYRCVTLAALRAGLDPSDARSIADLLCDLDVRFDAPVEPGGAQRVFFNGQDVTEAIRTPEVSRSTSVVADNPDVRERMVSLQRRMGERGGVVMEGRDIGTVVFPDAEVKFYLDADEEVRAIRRHKELECKGLKSSFSNTLDDLRDRDERDRKRPVGGLRIADGAEVVDTSELSIEGAVARLEALTRDR